MTKLETKTVVTVVIELLECDKETAYNVIDDMIDKKLHHKLGETYNIVDIDNISEPV